MYFVRFIKGILLGCTAVIPGISIGTMALVLDVYTKIISSFTFFLTPRRWKNKKDFFDSVFFLFPILLGIVLAMSFFASIILFLLKDYESFVRISFSGIIIGTLPFIFLHHVHPYFLLSKTQERYKKDTQHPLLLFLFFCIGFGIIFLLGRKDVATQAEVEVMVNLSEIVRAFLFGLISAAFGIIPGISGSYILLLMGYYSSFLYILQSLTLPLFIPLILGSVIGLVGVALAIGHVLTRYPAVAYGIIFGMVVASLIKITPWGLFVQFSFPSTPITFICLCFGLSLGVLSEKLSKNSQ